MSKLTVESNVGTAGPQNMLLGQGVIACLLIVLHKFGVDFTAEEAVILQGTGGSLLALAVPCLSRAEE